MARPSFVRSKNIHIAKLRTIAAPNANNRTSGMTIEPSVILSPA
jgi:hypothetical protein